MARDDRGHKAPLYRKLNTATHHARRETGGEFRHERHAKHANDWDSTRAGMHGRQRHGYDYTPLFRFLLSRVGRRWDEVHSEAIARLDRPDPIFLMVAAPGAERRAVVRTGHSSYVSGLYVDDAGILQLVDPELGEDTLEPSCKCCTHTFNGLPFTRACASE